MFEFCDSFQHLGTNADNLIPFKWDNVSGVFPGLYLQPLTGPRGGTCLFIDNRAGALFFSKSVSAETEKFVGFRRQKVTASGGFNYLVQFKNSGFAHIALLEQDDNYIQVRRAPGAGDQNLGITSIPLPNAYTYIEADVLVDAVAGRVVIRFDGNLVFSYTGNTKSPAAAAPILEINCGSDQSSGSQIRYADFVIISPSGVAPNSFVGPVAVDAGLPTGPGFYTEWTPLAPPNWSEVNENPPDFDTSYVEAAAVARDTYTFPALGVITGNVLAIAINAMTEDTGGGGANLSALVRSAAVDDYGPPQSVPASYHDLQGIFAKDPAGNPWTIASVNAAEFGQALGGGLMLYEDLGGMEYADTGRMEYAT